MPEEKPHYRRHQGGSKERERVGYRPGKKDYMYSKGINMRLTFFFLASASAFASALASFFAESFSNLD